MLSTDDPAQWIAGMAKFNSLPKHSHEHDYLSHGTQLILLLFLGGYLLNIFLSQVLSPAQYGDFVNTAGGLLLDWPQPVLFEKTAPDADAAQTRIYRPKKLVKTVTADDGDRHAADVTSAD